MRKSFIMLSIALIASGSIESKNPRGAQLRTPTSQEKRQIMEAIGQVYDVNTSFTSKIQGLIKQVDVNFKDSSYYNNTPLNAAARIAANKKLSFLLANGAGPSLTIQNSGGETPLANAAENGNFETVRLILEWSNKNGIEGKSDPASLLQIKDNYEGGPMAPLRRAAYSMVFDPDSSRGKSKDYNYEKTIEILQSFSK